MIIETFRLTNLEYVILQKSVDFSLDFGKKSKLVAEMYEGCLSINNPAVLQVSQISPSGRIIPACSVPRQTASILINTDKKVNQTLYRSEVPRGFQEVKVPRLRDNDP